MKSDIKYIFQSSQARAIIQHIAAEYGDELEYLWQNTPEYAICRNRFNDKWYILFMALPARRLGLDSDDLLEVIDIRYQKSELLQLLDGDKYLPAYHMNKANWLTIVLDGRVSTRELKQLVDNSYQISVNK